MTSRIPIAPGAPLSRRLPLRILILTSTSALLLFSLSTSPTVPRIWARAAEDAATSSSSLQQQQQQQQQQQKQPQPQPSSTCNWQDETEIKIDTETGDGDSLERSRALRPPTVESTLGGEAEGADWWNDHSDLLRRAWDEWWELLQALEPATTQTSSTITAGRGLPALDVHQMVRPDLAWDAHRARTHPSLVNERNVLSHWELMAVGKNKSSKHRHNNSNGGEENEDEHKMGVGSESVARCPGFLTPFGIRLLRTHLDAISNSGIPVRRPNAMNRRGLLLEPSVPGGVEGGPQLREFLEVLVGDYLRPIGRSLFPELAGDPADDSQFYAFTIRYEATEGTETDEPTTTTTTTVPHDTDLGEHSDASLYTLNLNLNLPDEDYEGSSLYFAPEKDPPRKTDHRTGTRIGTRTLVDLAPGTAVVHRGSTKHGALPIVRGQRHNLVVWLHGPDGYVRTHPYPDREWLSVEERWDHCQHQHPNHSSGCQTNGRFIPQQPEL